MKTNPTSRHERTIRIRLASIAIAAAGVAASHSAYATPCEVCAEDTLRAEIQETNSDYWVERAKADHIPNAAERTAAIAAAVAARDEALLEADARYEARLDLCLDLEEIRYSPVIAPANFDGGAVNPFMPLSIGTTLTYEGETEDGTETVVVTVTADTRVILGIECAIVRDTVYLDGEVIEDTFDYFSTDDDGNVWYFGENTAEYEDGYIVSTEGAWIAGENGAKPGIVMLGDPHIGDVYRQEFDVANAEDAGEILANNRDVTVPAGSYSGCLKTGDFTTLEPDALEYKLYAPGVGLVKEVSVDSGESIRLISIEN